ncbi:MAG: Enolase [Phycisphaerales bacterium]|nr:Enolase [Phycisphaerales bacterium]
MGFVEQVRAMEVLDSRGRPTVKARVRLAGGAVGSASVPSGASTGSAEALELRDGDPRRYGGLGCRRAVENVNEAIAGALVGKVFADQQALDREMIELDGTPNKGRLGANAILAVSIAFARALAAAREVPLWEQFARVVGTEPAVTLPRLTVNLFSGGKHAGEVGPAIQDVLVVPAAARTIDEGLATVYAVYQSAAKLIRRKYGMGPLTADEGGLAPPVQTAEELLDDAVESIVEAGLTPGSDVSICVDVAASHFYREGRYHLAKDRPGLDSSAMIEHLARWVERYPIVSVEDGLAEEDWSNWPALRAAIGSRALVVGDDLLCTNPARIRKAIEAGAADTLLLKVNQIGTLSEAAEACRLARAAGWRVTVSARSGETEDNWLADLAVGWGGDQIKVGSITQSERLVKYNRLLEIEAATGFGVVAWPAER